MSVNHQVQQIKHNLQQQTKRLISQLQQLQEAKNQLTEQQYNELKQSSIQQLKTFQHSLNNLLADPKNSILQSDIQKSKRAIFEAFKSQFNKQEVMTNLMIEQAKGTRTRIAQLQHNFHLKSLSEAEYVSKKRKLIVQIQQIGAKLTKQEQQWLNLHHHFADKTTQQIKQQIQKNKVKLVQQKLQENN